MEPLSLRLYPDPVLTIPSRVVPEITSEVDRLIEQMLATMRQAKGVGLAAPQVGQSLRILVLEHTPDADDGHPAVPLQVLVNPKLISTTGGTEVETEGCLSIPGIEVPVPRARKVKVRALDRAGQPLQFRASGFHARILQHELDHLDGKLIIDYAKNLARMIRRLKESHRATK